MMGWMFSIVAATLLSVEHGGVSIKVDSETEIIDSARSVFLTVELKTPRGKQVEMPDLRDRVKGFSLAEDFPDKTTTEKDGSVVQTAKWRLVPKPCDDEYKIKAFVVGDFWAGPIYFKPPPKREAVTGGMEIDPKKDIKTVIAEHIVLVLFGVLALAGIVWGLCALTRYLMRRIREHRMSPIERAWIELDRLLEKGLPGRGHYKDFYIELTMIVRRYVQRKYDIKAPHLTTEEFFEELSRSKVQSGERAEQLRRFLESADLVKFAGVEATPDMADGATESARNYLKSDDSVKENK